MGGENLSVVVPVRDHRNCIRECLKSVILQREEPGEVLVVDWGSSDGTLDILADDYPSVRVAGAPPAAACRTVAGALNHGIRSTGRPLVAFVFPGVKLDKGYFQAVLSELEKPENGDAGSATGKLFRMYSGPKVLDSTGLCMGQRGPLPSRRSEGQPDSGGFDGPGRVFGAPHGAAVYRRSMLESLSRAGEVFDESLDGPLGDVDLALRAHSMGWEGLYVPAATAWRDPKGDGRGPTRGDALRWEVGLRSVLLKNSTTGDLVRRLPRLVLSDAGRLVREPAFCVTLIFSTARLAGKWMDIRRKRQSLLRPQ